MRITFVGLSCFLLENKRGDKLLIDVFNDTPQWALGLKLPKNLKADLFLTSHADSDHAGIDEKFAIHRKKYQEKAGKDGAIFPGFNLKGTIVKEWNGDLCFAYHFTIDGIRFLHLADNSHALSAQQIKEIGPVDVMFLPMSKSLSDNIEMELKIIKQINPKIIIPSHIIPLSLSREISQGYEKISNEISSCILAPKLVSNNNFAANEYTVEVFTWMLLAVKKLTDKIPTNIIPGSSMLLERLPKKQTIYYFDRCLAKRYK
ncbi:MAG: Zn-dependent hydrolase of the beta-lactamase fold protein [Parcubacteria group bacterium GW2011_GWC2_38_7]|nr:MAG: Zn-dependent hydrolase of the beta-lactamase fold protein [Parcubacteria group bacterium GW2011_GWC2_38_7]